MARIESGVEFDKDKNHEKLTKLMDNKDTVQYPLRIPKNMYKHLKIKLANDEKNLREVLLDFIEKYLNKETKK